jgi:hypothetical protein
MATWVIAAASRLMSRSGGIKGLLLGITLWLVIAYQPFLKEPYRGCKELRRAPTRLSEYLAPSDDKEAEQAQEQQRAHEGVYSVQNGLHAGREHRGRFLDL